MSLPYHDIRKPAEIQRSDYAVSSNIGRTLDSARQGVIDLRCCLDWLESQGYTELGVIGTSLGSCYSFHVRCSRAAHQGGGLQSCLHLFFRRRLTASPRAREEGLETAITSDRLRPYGAPPVLAYFDKYARFPRKSLIIFATYDLTFLPEYSKNIIGELRQRNVDLQSHRTSLRPLHLRRGALQLHGRLASGDVCPLGISSGFEADSLTQCRSKNTNAATSSSAPTSPVLDIDAVHAFLRRSFWAEQIPRETVVRASRVALLRSLSR